MTRRVDADIEKVLPLLPLKDAANLTPQRAREELTSLAESRKDLPLPQPAAVADTVIAGVTGPIAARLYRPAKRPAATVVFFHGGGWVAGDLNTHDRNARTLAIELEAVVLSVDYRRPPETPFPGTFDDCLAATRWAAENIGELGGDGHRLAVAGDSAGGNLAAVVALDARDRGGPPLVLQLLIYPATDMGLDRPSHARHAEQLPLRRSTMHWFVRHYLRSPADEADWRASPLRAPSFRGLPPALVVTAGFDPLGDEGEAYARALTDAGVPVVHQRFEGQIHGFLNMGRIVADSSRLIALAGSTLERAFKAV
jgi:acetyl esterase/lipase